MSFIKRQRQLFVENLPQNIEAAKAEQGSKQQDQKSGDQSSNSEVVEEGVFKKC